MRAHILQMHIKRFSILQSITAH